MGSSGAEKTLAGMRSELACPVVAMADFTAKAVRSDSVAQIVGPFASEILSGAPSGDTVGPSPAQDSG